jgi:heme-degrading monooxygenase HmoA
MAAVLINLFEVEPSADDAFVAAWERARDHLHGSGGFVETALHRSLSPAARFRYVNVARIDDVPAWEAAVTSPDFPRDVPARAPFPGHDMPYPSNPMLYEVIR